MSKWHLTKREPAYNTSKILLADIDNAEVVVGYYQEHSDIYCRLDNDKRVNAVAWTELPVFNFKLYLEDNT